MYSCSWPPCHGVDGSHCPRWHATWTASYSLTSQSEIPAPPPQRHWPCGSVCSVIWHLLHNSIEDSTAHYRLIKHPEQSGWCWRTSAISTIREVSFPSCRVRYPVQLIISVDPQILIILHNVNTDTLDGNGSTAAWFSPGQQPVPWSSVDNFVTWCERNHLQLNVTKLSTAFLYS